MPDAKMQRPMLAKDADIEKVGFPLVVQYKYDGIRALVGDDGLYSRTLKQIPNREIAAYLCTPEFYGLDGEIIVGSPTADDCYRRTASFVMAPNKTGEDWKFYAFDRWDMDDAPYMRRRTRVYTDKAVNECPRIVPVKGEIVTNMDELNALEEEAIAEGHEGLIARVPNAPYKHGRSGSRGPLAKVKRFLDFEAEVIGVFERMHNGNEAQTNELGRTFRSSAKDGKTGRGDLGGLVLRAVNGPYKGQEFRCGTGFDDAMRAALWAEDLTGRIAVVKHFPIGAKDAPRFPVFKGWRSMEIDG